MASGLDRGRLAVVSASPELFSEWAGDQVRTRPMTGTASRGRTPAADERPSSALRASSKEQAENVMIVDLLRNDLGRIAEVGSVTVDEPFALERYPTVWQPTSQVSARVRPDVGLPELFGALFPCGSITGAPEQRSMELIRDLEPTPRGVYCGGITWGSDAARERAELLAKAAVLGHQVVDRRPVEPAA